MLYSFLYPVVRFLLETLIVRSRSEARLRAEVFAVRGKGANVADVEI